METLQGFETAPVGTAVAVATDIDIQRRELYGPRLLSRLGPRSRSPNPPPSSAPQSFRRLNYIPSTFLPLQTQKEVPSGTQSSNGSQKDIAKPEDDGLIIHRRSLRVQVVDVSSGTLLPSNSEISTIAKASSLLSETSITPLLKVQRSMTSVFSVGDYSRYPEWPQAGTDPPNVSPTTPRLDMDSEKQTDSKKRFHREDPERGFSLYLEGGGIAIQYPTIDEREDDDNLHNPDPNEKFRPSYKRVFLGVLCCSMTVCGIFSLFIVWPVLTYTRLASLYRVDGKAGPVGEERISNLTYSILGAARALIDIDTPQSAMTRDSVLGGGKLKLVFSDEFNKDSRSFCENEDPFWQAMDFYYAATNDLEWYDPDAVTTKDGTLRIKLDAFRNHDLSYRSGMLQSWNKLCFKGGVLEVSVSLPGPAGVPGLWPGIWTLGNLGRPGYMSTTDGVWPYAYDECDAGITPNQSSNDGLSFLPGQKLAKCICDGEDHPSPGTGRGAPEIDVLEAGADGNIRLGIITQSSQIAPFDIWHRPDMNFIAIKNPEFTQMNSWNGGPFQQAISGVTNLNNEWYDGKKFQKYAFEYKPGRASGVIAWFVGNEETFRMTGDAIGPNGNIGQRDISREPMSIILNLGISPSWTYIDWNLLGKKLGDGVTMYIDYVRIYQEEGEESVTCDPPGFPTTEYIKGHMSAYTNANLTLWEDTGYPWPKNKLIRGC